MSNGMRFLVTLIKILLQKEVLVHGYFFCFLVVIMRLAKLVKIPGTVLLIKMRNPEVPLMKN